MAGRRHRSWMNELLVGYARVSTEQQDFAVQRSSSAVFVLPPRWIDRNALMVCGEAA
jgi:hypothetical protein